MTPRPFTVRVPDEVLADLRTRLERVRWPDEIAGEGWRYGTSLAYMKELVAYWRDRYDWRAQEARLNALPQFTLPMGDLDLHFIHAKGVGPSPQIGRASCRERGWRCGGADRSENEKRGMS